MKVVLILQPLLGRNGKDICDVPVIAKETVKFEFLENAVPTTLKITTPFTTTRQQVSKTTNPQKWVDQQTSSWKAILSESTKTLVKATSIPNKEISTTKKYWWLEQTKNITIDVKDKSNKKIQFQNIKNTLNQGPVKGNIEHQKQVERDGFIIDTDDKEEKEGAQNDEGKEDREKVTTEVSKDDEEKEDRDQVTTEVSNLDKFTTKFEGKTIFFQILNSNYHKRK